MKEFLKPIVVFVLTLEAKIVLWRHKPKIIAITGSVGKTSTKDAIYTVISKGHHARKSEKSFNSELGVPLTILGLPTAWSSPIAWLENILEGFGVALFSKEYPDWLVLEVGADRPGDIGALAWLEPHVVVFTFFPDVPVHVEFFESAEQVVAEKRKLKSALRENGTLIINADDPKMARETVLDGQHVISYGFADEAMLRAETPEVMYTDGVPNGMRAKVHFQNKVEEVTINQVLGAHQLYPVLAALAGAVGEGLSFGEAATALSEHVSPPGRMRILFGCEGSCIIDDTYNASPVATAAGLDATKELVTKGKKIVVLGDMLELGDYSVAEHKRIGEQVAHMADVFVAIGVRMRNAAESAKQVKRRKKFRVETFTDVEQAADLMYELVEEGDVLFVKGSQSMRMERLVARLLRDPTTAEMLLVRQDKEWKSR